MKASNIEYRSLCSFLYTLFTPVFIDFFAVLYTLSYLGRVPYRDKDEHRKASREYQRRKRAAARAAGGAAIPVSARKALAGKLQRAAESLKVKPSKKKKPAKPKPSKKKKSPAKAKRAKVVGRITPKGKAKAPPPGSSGPVDPGGIVRVALRNAERIVLSDEPFSLHDSKQAIDLVRSALETIAVVDSHRPPAQVEAEMSQFTQVALDFIPQKRRADCRAAFVKALKAAT